MRKEKQIKILALMLALTIAVVTTVMILGIQIGFSKSQTGLKITAPLVTVTLVAVLFIFKTLKKANKTSLLVKYAESKGKKMSPYFTIGFAYFDYMLYCGILSGLCGIVASILRQVYMRLVFENLNNWAYCLERMAIVFAIYILCLFIYTLGCMIAYSKRPKGKEDKDERI